MYDRDKLPFATRLGAGRPLEEGEKGEARYWIERLEAAGYVVRKPSEAHLESVMEIEHPGVHGHYDLGVRVDMTFNGVALAMVRRFPIEMVLDPNDAGFRKRELPRILAGELGHYLADRLMPGIAAQVQTKIEPLVPEKQMSLDEIVRIIASALQKTKRRVDTSRHNALDRPRR